MLKNTLLIFSLTLFLFSCLQTRPVKDCSTFTEAADPCPDTLAGWNSVEQGLQGAVGSIDILYAKSSVPEVVPNFAWSGSAWIGERVSAQIVLWSGESVKQVECEFSDFKSKDNKVIPASIAQTRFVRYVITDEFADGCGRRKPEDYASSLGPDMLDPLECFDIEPQTTRPVWISFNVPPDATPGIYNSTLTIFSAGSERMSFTFQLEILPRILPPGTDREFHLDLWQNPYAVARIHGVDPWSDAHWEALHPIMKMLADAGQKVITATLNKRPWGGQTQDAFDSMIGWTKKSDGSWVYDYTIFDNWVQFMQGLGIKKQINCYSMVPWGNELYYFDERSGGEVKVKVDPGTKEYEEIWIPFLKDFSKHLKEKNWLKITRIAMDERNPTEMKEMLKLLADIDPGLGVALADNHKSYKLFPDKLKDLCVAHNAVVEENDLAYRKANNYVTTWYVCCADIFPNTFTFSSPAESAFIGWYTMAAGFDGFLRWAYNSWVTEPHIDSRFRTWPAGDTYIVYPEARSSIRFERLIEGIQDAEKIRILRKEFKNLTTDQAKENLQLLNQTLAQFNTRKKPDDLEGLMSKGKLLLVELSR